jgi:hypothetical protein
MFARPAARHSQVAYVTNDLDRAIAVFEQDFGAPGFFSFNTADAGVGGPDSPKLRIALTNVGGVEIELIQPLANAALYQDALTPGDDLQIRFHHTCIRIDGTLQDWDSHVASIDFAKHPRAIEGGLADEMRFIYTDERPRLGHYVEHVWMSPAMLAHMNASVPHYPAEA